MRKIPLLTAVALGLAFAGPASAQQTQTPTGTPARPTAEQGGGQGTQVQGTVQEVNKQGNFFTMDGQRYVIPPNAGTSMMPEAGNKVSVFYEEREGQRVILRIGQAQQ